MIQYKIATLVDMPEVAKVHQKCFPGTFIASFGQKLITDYYTEFFNENPLFVLVEKDGAIEGFCMGYITGSEARNNFMSKFKVRLAFRMLYLCMTFNKLAIQKCLAFVMPKKNSAPSKKIVADADLLSICVTDNMKGSGAAKELVCKFEDLLKARNVKNYTLAVYKDNARAIGFYNKMGFETVAETFDEYKMIKSI